MSDSFPSEVHIHLLRHAQSYFNVYKTSPRNCLITDIGISQASQTKKPDICHGCRKGQSEDIKFPFEYDVIICSPLTRAILTLLYRYTFPNS
jgi:broad specificity phosphatase PhoE